MWPAPADAKPTSGPWKHVTPRGHGRPKRPVDDGSWRSTEYEAKPILSPLRSRPALNSCAGSNAKKYRIAPAKSRLTDPPNRRAGTRAQSVVAPRGPPVSFVVWGHQPAG